VTDDFFERLVHILNAPPEAEDDGDFTGPFEKVIVVEDSLAEALREFKQLEAEYSWVDTIDVNWSLSEKGQQRTADDLTVDIEDLSRWHYYIHVFEAAGGVFPDRWSGQNNPAMKGQNEERLTPLLSC